MAQLFGLRIDNLDGLSCFLAVNLHILSKIPLRPLADRYLPRGDYLLLKVLRDLREGRGIEEGDLAALRTSLNGQFVPKRQHCAVELFHYLIQQLERLGVVAAPVKIVTVVPSRIGGGGTPVDQLAPIKEFSRVVDVDRGSSGSGDTTTRVVPRTFVFIVDRGCLGGKDKVRHSHVAKRVLPAWSLYFPWHSRTFSLFLPQGRVSAPKFIFRHGQRYRLCRIVQHIGDTLQKGHYVVAVWKSGRWCRCSDADVASLSPRGLADMEPSVAMYEICSSTISAQPRRPRVVAGAASPPRQSKLRGAGTVARAGRRRQQPPQVCKTGGAGRPRVVVGAGSPPRQSKLRGAGTGAGRGRNRPSRLQRRLRAVAASDALSWTRAAFKRGSHVTQTPKASKSGGVTPRVIFCLKDVLASTYNLTKIHVHVHAHTHTYMM